jgi:hypothetical protein
MVAAAHNSGLPRLAVCDLTLMSDLLISLVPSYVLSRAPPLGAGAFAIEVDTQITS